MQKGARKVGVWKEVREAALKYLKTGELPAGQAKADKAKSKEEISGKEELSILPGILPKTGLLEAGSIQKIETPAFDLLIEIAIQEEDPEEVVYWYEELKKSGAEAESHWLSISENQIANTVKVKYPEIALDIWKKRAEKLISETKVSSYEEAFPYLRKVKETLEASGKKEAWEAYLSEIKKVNKRKKKLLEILDRLGADRIIGE
ncbi:hypothetical protein MSSAC_0415 [Methanosarcina siciliae C2J]|uniref:Uncharacterized protein n=1 Tax=Methanosarcina siciliae C2J TaxID=1434118 RepID=A0A0E3PJ93_9EURY|nr:hypothetical protein [Methanosarcina siciliae]AKB35005.1 hypothetical protein MSSAC_0415 [Methanosarcina siciliae C2J]